ncbi:MAG: protein phosphatase 2C domain-containing protein [Betaproteobacteria bacterium]|nr:protein phosphatase 2C domain-containing protein [Betaproteobacteria bacterium]
MRVSVETSVARHVGDRREQQDRVAVLTHPLHPAAVLIALADGMGGQSGGAMAAEQIIHAAQQNLEAFSPATEQPTKLLSAVVQDAHSSIRLGRFSNEQNPHSTIVVFLLYRGRAYWVHCGDSRLYHFRNTKMVMRTRDHSLVGELQRRGKLTAEEALHHPQRNVLVSCLGSDRTPQAEMGGSDSVVAGDCFLLCSDGLWSFFSDEELADTLFSLSADKAAKHLLELARKRSQGNGDNISLAIIRFVATNG